MSLKHLLLVGALALLAACSSNAPVIDESLSESELYRKAQVDLDAKNYGAAVETLRALEEALLDFPGAAIVISHDRWFLDRIATHILAYEDDSQVTFFEGNYTEYEADRKKRLGDAAAQPHRVRYKKLA